MGEEAWRLDEGAHRVEHIGSGVHWLAIDVDRARVWSDQTNEHADHGCLSGTVGTKQSYYLAGLRTEGDAVHSPKTVTVGLHHLVHDQRDAGQLSNRLNPPAPAPKH